MKLDRETACILTWKHAREGVMVRIGPFYKLWHIYRAIKSNDNSQFDLRIFETDEKINLTAMDAEYKRRKEEKMIYTIVIHTPTKRAFTLDRGYNMVEPLVVEAFPSMFGPVEPGTKWEGWVPRYEHQRPEWANEILREDRDDEFTAWWLKEACQLDQPKVGT